MITSGNQRVGFPSFVLTVFWCSTSNTVINCVLKDVNGACWRTCSLMALRVPHKCSWPAKTRKKLSFFEMHTCLWPGAQIWFRHKWGKLVTASLLLPCIDWYSCPRYWNEFFLSCVSGFKLKFSRIAFWRKRLQLDSKSDVTTNGLILGFFVGKWRLSLTSYLCGLKSAKIAQLLLFVDDVIFFAMSSLRCILVCSSKMLVLFSRRIL